MEKVWNGEQGLEGTRRDLVGDWMNLPSVMFKPGQLDFFAAS